MASRNRAVGGRDNRSRDFIFVTLTIFFLSSSVARSPLAAPFWN
jgi:hypothetical protein